MKKLNLLPALFLSGFLYSCNDTGQRIETADSVSEMATEDTAVWYDNDANWVSITRDAPVVVIPELEGTEVTVRQNDSVTVYEANDDILFDLDKAQIKPSGVEKLQKIADNIKSTTQGTGMIRVFGHTDSLASKEYNMELGRERAKSVEDWLTANAGFDANRIKVISKGQSQPVATNATPAGRQQNRRVEIAVVRAQD